MRFGPEYLIPFPFDHRVLLWIAPAVAWAAVASGVAREFIDLDTYRDRLEERLGRARGIMRGVINRSIQDPKRVVFPEERGTEDHPRGSDRRGRRDCDADPAGQSRGDRARR